MTKSDFERLSSEENEAQRLTHEGLTTPQFVAERMSWGQIMWGAAALIASVGGAAYWAGGQSVKTDNPKGSSIHQTQAALAPAEERPGIGQEQVALQPIELAPLTPPDQAIGLPTQRTSVSFMLPVEGETVGPTLMVRGMASGVPAGRQLWLATQRASNSEIWPKEQISLAPDGSFEMQIWDFGADGPFSVCLLASDVQDSRRFEDWLSAGDKEDEWPAMRLDRAHSSVLGCQDAKLNKQIQP